MSFVLEHSYLIPLLPLLAAVVVGLFGKTFLRGWSHLPIWAGVGAAAGLSITLLLGLLSDKHDGHSGEAVGFSTVWFEWFRAGAVDSGEIIVGAGAWIDPLTSVMLAVVCGIGFLITIFAAGYMKGERGYWRFFAYLGLFIFAMTCLVMGDNLVMLYLGWEGVGLCSYLLIGYDQHRIAASNAARKAFIVNRIGDFGFAVGIMLTWYCFGTVSYFGSGLGGSDGFLEMVMHWQTHVPADRQFLVEWIPIALMLGAFGKSAQFPLHVWLPDAMEGPTPVSALIHAATMVTAGVYMIARLGGLFVAFPDSLFIVAIVGAVTAVLGATIALRQFDLKRVFAYSTVSQLGFMFVAVGVLAPVAGVFHLVTHAFFKALLFLSSGVVMHATGGQLDLRKISGLKKHLPITRVLCLIGCLALAGFPVITAGFWSKDEILVGAAQVSVLLYVTLSITAFLTAYYTFRLYFRVFEGPAMFPQSAGHHGSDDHGHSGHDEHHAKSVDKHAKHDESHAHHHSHEPLLLIVPLVILAIGALVVGVVNLPFSAGVKAHSLGYFLGQSPSFIFAHDILEVRGTGIDATQLATQFGQLSEKHAKVHWVAMGLSAAISILGIGLAFVLHLKDRAKGDALARQFAGVANLFERKYFIDELYNRLLVGPLRAIAYLLDALEYVWDGLASLVAMVPQTAGGAIRLTMQRGYLQGYALTAIVGLAVLLWWVLA
jgi:NADH-quinone oxidoreductase subunit L